MKKVTITQLTQELQYANQRSYKQEEEIKILRVENGVLKNNLALTPGGQTSSLVISAERIAAAATQLVVSFQGLLRDTKMTPR